MTQSIHGVQIYRECRNTPCFSYWNIRHNGIKLLPKNGKHMSELIPVPNEMARKYRYVTSQDELLAILTTNNLF